MSGSHEIELKFLCAPEDLGAVLDEGATAVVCDSPTSAEQGVQYRV